MKRLTATLALWAAITACAQAAEPITLGLNYPRTGPYKEEGLAQMRGALLAIDEINAKGGVLGRPVRLESRDTASRPEKAVKNINSLADQGAAMLFGGASSAVAIAAGQQPQLTANPLIPVMTITAYIVQISLGDTPHGTLEYRTIFVCGLTLFLLTFVLNVISFKLKRRFQEIYD